MVSGRYVKQIHSYLVTYSWSYCAGWRQNSEATEAAR